MLDVQNLPDLDEAELMMFEQLWSFLDQPADRSGCQPPEIAIIRNLFGIYQRGAKKRNLEWHLTETEFAHLILSPCHYCMSPCSNLRILFKNRKHSLQYNGIDRYDNTIGYIANNCVPSCYRCNSVKSAIPPEHWERWLDRVAARTLERRAR